MRLYVPFTNPTANGEVSGVVDIQNTRRLTYHAPFYRSYSIADARLLADWLNGEDHPLDVMRSRGGDDSDPSNRFPNRIGHQRLGP